MDTTDKVKPFRVVKGDDGAVTDLLGSVRKQKDVRAAMVVLFVGEGMEPVTMWSEDIDMADLMYGSRYLSWEVEQACFNEEEYE